MHWRLHCGVTFQTTIFGELVFAAPYRRSPFPPSFPAISFVHEIIYTRLNVATRRPPGLRVHSSIIFRTYSFSLQITSLILPCVFLSAMKSHSHFAQCDKAP